MSGNPLGILLTSDEIQEAYIETWKNLSDEERRTISTQDLALKIYEEVDPDGDAPLPIVSAALYSLTEAMELFLEGER